MEPPVSTTVMLDEAMDEWLWPAACPELRQMESALRCQICGDFFHGPVLLPCTHTFCSECVRRFLQSRANHGWCPECKQPCTPGELVPNRSLEKIGVLFQQMKPTVLPVLEKATKLLDASKAATPTKTSNGHASDGRPPERMALLSYSVMKEKDIKKLLDTIGIRAPIKNREEIIQVHKEYVLLSNAQADSSHPKSAKQIRDEVMRNYRARQAEKTASGSARKVPDAGGQSPVVSVEMQKGFERLRQQVAARKKQLEAKQDESKSGNGSQATPDDAGEDGEVEEDEAGGVWRHVHAVGADQEFYIHSTTQEIRTEPPQAFLDRQRRLRARRDQQRAAVPVNDDDKNRDQEQDSDDPVVVGTRRSAPSSQTELSKAENNDDDDDDFEIVMTTPPPKPHSRQSTPRSSRSGSGRKQETERRRRSVESSLPTSLSSSNRAAAFFSQETSCSIQETSTQLASSSSLSLSTEEAVQNDADGSQRSVSIVKWDCPRCTLVNESPGDSAVTECEACGYRHQHRPARKKQKLQFQSKLFQP